mmetsp:Transcript_18836/g.36956  ORF Transcript_18836/g.36956 Transcript_18836/m.36956 type:complete len:782 (-) Transcript_18836:73-2418(-)
MVSTAHSATASSLEDAEHGRERRASFSERGRRMLSTLATAGLGRTPRARRATVTGTEVSRDHRSREDSIEVETNSRGTSYSAQRDSSGSTSSLNSLVTRTKAANARPGEVQRRPRTRRTSTGEISQSRRSMDMEDFKMSAAREHDSFRFSSMGSSTSSNISAILNEDFESPSPWVSQTSADILEDRDEELGEDHEYDPDLAFQDDGVDPEAEEGGLDQLEPLVIIDPGAKRGFSFSDARICQQRRGSILAATFKLGDEVVILSQIDEPDRGAWLVREGLVINVRILAHQVSCEYTVQLSSAGCEGEVVSVHEHSLLESSSESAEALFRAQTYLLDVRHAVDGAQNLRMRLEATWQKRTDDEAMFDSFGRKIAASLETLRHWSVFTPPVNDWDKLTLNTVQARESLISQAHNEIRDAKCSLYVVRARLGFNADHNRSALVDAEAALALVPSSQEAALLRSMALVGLHESPMPLQEIDRSGTNPTTFSSSSESSASTYLQSRDSDEIDKGNTCSINSEGEESEIYLDQRHYATVVDAPDISSGTVVNSCKPEKTSRSTKERSSNFLLDRRRRRFGRTKRRHSSSSSSIANALAPPPTRRHARGYINILPSDNAIYYVTERGWTSTSLNGANMVLKDVVSIEESIERDLEISSTCFKDSKEQIDLNLNSMEENKNDTLVFLQARSDALVRNDSELEDNCYSNQDGNRGAQKISANNFILETPAPDSLCSSRRNHQQRSNTLSQSIVSEIDEFLCELDADAILKRWHADQKAGFRDDEENEVDIL